MKIGLRLESSSVRFCHVKERTRVKRQGTEQKKETSNNEIQEERLVGRTREEAERRTQLEQNNGKDKRRQGQLKGDKIEERWRGGKENTKTNVGK